MAVDALLGPEERAIGAFVGVRGPRPGVEAFGILVFVASLLLFGTGFIAWPAAAAFVLAVAFTRKNVTVARTNQGVLVIENGRKRVPPATASVARLPVNAIAIADGDSDPSVHVGGERLWVNGAQQDEARRLSRLPSGG